MQTKTLFQDFIYPYYWRFRQKIRSFRWYFWLRARRKYSVTLKNPLFGSRENTGDIVDPYIISFATQDGLYDMCMARLRESVEEHSGVFVGATIPESAPVFAVRFKPSFIKYQLLTLKRPVLWADADSVVSGSISLPCGDWDIGVYYTGNYKWGRMCVAGDCLAFRPTRKAIDFLSFWEFLCVENQMGHSDHPDLLWAFSLYKKKLKILDLKEHISGKFTSGKDGVLTIHR